MDGNEEGGDNPPKKIRKKKSSDSSGSGGGMGGHGHGPPYVIPPASQFQVQGVPQLEELERALAKKNLKDPWIRNEAWRYHPGFGTKWQRARKVFFRGLPLGAALTAIVVGADTLMKKTGGGDHAADAHH